MPLWQWLLDAAGVLLSLALIYGIALVIRRRGKVLVAQRPSSGRWASLWEFPHVELAPREAPAAAARRLLSDLQLRADLGRELATLRHGVTRFRITLACLEAHHRHGRCRSKLHTQARWVTPAELHHALLDVLHGGVPMTSGIARRVAGFFRRRGEVRQDTARLSQRETEVLDLLAKGFVNKEIADKLSLSVETIRSYLKNIYEKMHVHSRAEAVAKYITGRGGSGHTRS